MTGLNFQDTYRFNVGGNWQQSLGQLNNSLDNVSGAFQALQQQMGVQQQAFRRTAREMRAAGQAGNAMAEAANRASPQLQVAADEAQRSATAYASLVKEVNKAGAAVIRESRALQLRSEQAQPNVIAVRAEARAYAQLSKAVELHTSAVRVQELAAEAGLQLNAEGTRIFDAQAEALRRATRAAQELAVAQQLQQQGLDAQGRPVQAAPQFQGPLTPEAQRALNNLSAEEQVEARRRALEEERRARINETVRAIRGLETANQRAAAAQDRLNQQGDRASTIFGRFLFTFRRLVGVLAVFAAARAVARGFTEMVRGAVQFSSELEKNRVGLSGLIAASGQVLDAQGRRLSLEGQLTAAQDLSIVQMQKLRQAAIRTTATYEDLSEALSQSVAPGLSAGLNLDQIREITVSISQAASGLGVAQNQLSEEIRALFQGTITPRNTRIATALGITNADVRRAKEIGDLAGFLKTRFEAVSKAGERLADTFSGQLNAAQDAFKQLVAESSKPLFEQLKAGLKEFTAAIFDISAKDAIIDPQSLTLLDRFFKGLASGVAGIRAAFSDLNIEGFAQVFGTIGQALGLAGTVLANSFAAAFKVASPFFGILNSILSVFNAILVGIKGVNAATNGWLGTLALTALRIQLARSGLGLITGLMRTAVTRGRDFYRTWLVTRAAIQAGTAAVGGMTTAMRALNAASALFRLPVLLAVAAVGLLEVALRKLAGISLLEKIGSWLAAASDWINEVLNGFLGIEESAKDLTGDGLGQVANEFRQLASEIDEAVLDIQKSLRSFRKSTEEDIRLFGVDSRVADRLRAAEQARLSKVEELYNVERQISGAKTQQAEAAKQALISYERLQAAFKPLNESPKNYDALKDLVQIRKEIRELESDSSKLGGFSGISEEGKKLQKLREYEKIIRSSLGSAADLVEQVEAEIAARQALLQKYQEAQRAASAAAGAEVARSLELQRLLQLEKDLREAIFKDEIARAGPLTQLANLELQDSITSSILEAAEASEALGISDKGRLDIIRIGYEIRRADLATSQEMMRSERALEELRKKAAAYASVDSDEARLALSATERNIELLQQEQAIKQASAAATRAEAQERLRLANLRETGSIGDGFTETVRKLAEEKDSYYIIGENLAEALFTSVPQALGSIVSDALLNGFNSEKALESLRQLFANAVGNFVSDLITVQLAKAFSTAAAQPAADTAGLTATVAAAEAVSAAAPKVATTVGGALSSGAAAITAAGKAAAAAILSAAAAAKVSTMFNTATTAFGVASRVGFGAAFAGRAKGGPIGFARGGSSRRRGRPLGIDSRDTIPALLRPGEWVIRPEAVQHYGHRLFAMLNGRKINRSALSGVKKAASPSTSPIVPKAGFATGGRVASTAAPSVGGGSPVVLQFHDEQTMDRALAAGGDSMVRFTRANRSAMRSALGALPRD